MIAERNPDRPIDLISRRSVVEIGAFKPQMCSTNWTMLCRSLGRSIPTTCWNVTASSFGEV